MKLVIPGITVADVQTSKTGLPHSKLIYAWFVVPKRDVAENSLFVGYDAMSPC